MSKSLSQVSSILHSSSVQVQDTTSQVTSEILSNTSSLLSDEKIESQEHLVSQILIVGGNIVCNRQITAGIHLQIGTHSGGQHLNTAS